MECNVLRDSHLLHEVCRVEPGHDAVVPGGGQELVEGDGLATEVVLQSNDIYIGMMVNPGRSCLSGLLSLAMTAELLLTRLKTPSRAGGRGRGSFSSLVE